MIQIFILLAALSTPAFAQSICRNYFEAKQNLETDPYLEFEEVRGERVLDWARKQNQKTFERLMTDPRYQEIYEKVLTRLNSPQRLVYVSFFEKTDVVRNFWQDAQNPQGILRESTQERYFSGDYKWEVILDFDALSKAEGKNLVYKGTTYPLDNHTRAMIAISDAGKDAVEYREFDMVKREFVKDGFALPESKSSVSWLDENTLFVADALKPENETVSGYPRVIKLWRRGTPYESAEVVFETHKENLSVSAFKSKIGDQQQEVFVSVSENFYESQLFVLREGKLIELKLPKDADWAGQVKEETFLQLKSDWTIDGITYEQGSIVSFNFNEFLSTQKGIKLFLKPISNGTVESIISTDNYLYVTTLEDVQNRMYQYQSKAGEWIKREIPLPDFSSAGISSAPKGAGFLLMTVESFLAPPTIYKINEQTLEITSFQSLPEAFDASPFKVEQHFAISKDGTRVPYYMVSRKDLKLDGKNPVLQYGYGGFEITQEPGYSAGTGMGWLAYGGVFVSANIRGGGEYGPAWHQAALKENRHKAYEDFIAVSEDLITRGVTSPKYLAVEGGSNGGLLTGVMTTRRPDLYQGAIISVPLLDMMRFHKLLAGHSWTAEYGNPDVPVERAYLATYSPYQNLKRDQKYPEVFLNTSTADDRVHPGHARKFAKRMEEYGHPFLYYENLEGGHGGSANNHQRAQLYSLERVYLLQKLF